MRACRSKFCTKAIKKSSMTQSIYKLLFCALLLLSFQQKQFKPKKSFTQIIQNNVPSQVVIAHRGTTYWAPEETEAAYRWARNIGADYLELDIQRTKDGVLIALHDDRLKRTTNIDKIYPERKEQSVANFTYAELLQLDAGSWFNQVYSKLAREKFKGQNIVTLEDVVYFSRGYCYKRDINGQRVFDTLSNGVLKSSYVRDLQDNGHRPGLYIETKEPHLFPNIEQDLHQELVRLGMLNNASKPESFYKDGKVNVGNTAGKLVLQTFSKASLKTLHQLFPGVPLCFLLWLGDGDMPSDDLQTYTDYVQYALDNGAQFIGPSIGGAPNHYPELLRPWQARLIHDRGLHIHAYSFDTEEQMYKYANDRPPLTDGMFTNRCDLTLAFYTRKGRYRTSEDKIDGKGVLKQLGY